MKKIKDKNKKLELFPEEKKITKKKKINPVQKIEKETKNIVKIEIPDPVPVPFIKQYEVPLFLRASRQQLFCATERKVLEPLDNKESIPSLNMKIEFKVSCAFDVKDGKNINLGRLNDFDYRVWTIIKKRAMEQNKNSKESEFSFKVNISYYYISKKLGVKKYGGSQKRVIKESIKRLQKCTTELIIQKNRKKVEYTKGPYLLEGTFYEDSGDEIMKFSYLILNPLFKNEITEQKITKINYDVFKVLKSPLARWFHRALSSLKENEKTYDLQYIQNKSGQKFLRSNIVKKALDELVFANFLETYYVQRERVGKSTITKFQIIKKEDTIYRDYIFELNKVKKDDFFHYMIMKNFKVNYEKAKMISADAEDDTIIKMIKLMHYYIKKGKTIQYPLLWLSDAIKKIYVGPKDFEESWKKNRARDLIPDEMLFD